jgi:hypothetical protein
VLLVLARESIGDDTEHRLALFARRYNGLVNAVQIANEPDHVSESSWTMAPDDLNRLLRTARAVFGPSKLLIGPGLVSGHPEWAAQIDWSPVDAIAAHPYAKWPYTSELDALIGGYAAYGLPVWVTEYNARTLGMAAALRDDPRIGVALAFCYSDRVVDGFGLIEDEQALNDFVTASGGPLSPSAPSPAPSKPTFVLGFKRWHDLEPARLGDAVTNERNVAPGWQTQRTRKGTLCWIEGKGHAFIRDDGRVWRWQEDWSKSQEVKA